MRPALTTEPGRSIVSNAGVVVGRVRVVKGSWVFTDISLNDVPENLFFSEWRVFYPSRMHEPSVRKVHLSGPTLATNDVLLYDIEAPERAAGRSHRHVRHGSLLHQPRRTSSRGRAAASYFITADGQVEIIRHRETVEDVMRTQVWDRPLTPKDAPAPAWATAPVGSTRGGENSHDPRSSTVSSRFDVAVTTSERRGRDCLHRAAPRVGAGTSSLDPERRMGPVPGSVTQGRRGTRSAIGRDAGRHGLRLGGETGDAHAGS